MIQMKWRENSENSENSALDTIIVSHKIYETPGYLLLIPGILVHSRQY
jgi:hypothetical protein